MYSFVPLWIITVPGLWAHKHVYPISIFHVFWYFGMLPRFYSSAEGYPYKTQGLLAGTLLIWFSITVSWSFGWVDRKRLHRLMCFVLCIGMIYVGLYGLYSWADRISLGSRFRIFWYEFFSFNMNFILGKIFSFPTVLTCGSNLVVTNAKRGVLRSQLSWVYVISSGRLNRMIGKPWLRVKWGGSLAKRPWVL